MASPIPRMMRCCESIASCLLHDFE
jgi:hypothetical protein